MTVSASIPAAVVSMAVLRLLRRNSIVENNIVQTAASSGEAVSSGAIFTLPALVLMGAWQGFDYLTVTLIAGLGGLLGVLMTIPLRRALIVEENLKFPEGVATAEVLKAGHAGKGVGLVVAAAGAGGLFKLGESGLQVWTASIQAAGRIGRGTFCLGASLSPALLSVGYIVGLNIAVLILLGGLANWLVAIPLYAAWGGWPAEAGVPLDAGAWAHRIWSTRTRYLGVGGMLVGGLWSIWRMRRSIVAGIRSGLAAYRPASGRPELPRTERDVPMKWVLLLLAASVVPLFLVYQAFVGRAAVAAPMAVLMLVAGFLFSAVAGYMAGVVGSSNNPISGVTIATVLTASLLLMALMGAGAAQGPAAAIALGAVVCCAAAIAGDNLQDLKTGQLVGSTPWKQQIIEMVSTVVGAMVVAPVLTLLLKAYGFQGHASAKAGALAAPQANLMASVAKGVFAGHLPWGFVAGGAAIGVAVILADCFLERRGKAFRLPVLAVAIGFYLPLELSAPIFAGGVIHSLAQAWRARGRPAEDPARAAAGPGLLLASGLITGEALAGILLAIPIVVLGSGKALAIVKEPLGAWPGLLLLAAIAAWLARTAAKAETEC